jgi:transposase
MQSTEVYWIPIYDILEERAMQVYLVNARHTKNLPGRKSDLQESQWLLKLPAYGLLNNSFQPPSKIRVLHTYWRQWGEHVRLAATSHEVPRTYYLKRITASSKYRTAPSAAWRRTE